MVASGTRKARAISAVLSPPSSRSVSATWTSAASAGWAQPLLQQAELGVALEQAPRHDRD
jgi:hypothetical protein